MTDDRTLLERLLGGPAVQVSVDGDLVDPDAVGPITINQGRSRAGDTPEPASCGFAVYVDALAELPEIGAPVVVELSEDALTFFDMEDVNDPGYTRFTGRITDLAHGGGSRPILSIVAVSLRGGIEPRAAVDVGEQVDVAGNIVADIFDELPDFDLVDVGLEGDMVDTTDAYGTSPWTACKTVGDQIRLLALSTHGELVELRYGGFTWQDATVRGETDPAVSLTAEEALIGSQCIKNFDGIVNNVKLTHGRPGPAGQSSTTSSNSDSVTAFGQIDATVATILAETDVAPTNPGSAYFLDWYLARHGFPIWQTPVLAVELVRALDMDAFREKARGLLRAEQGTLLELTGDHGLPLADSRMWLEGWTETISKDGWRMSLNTSDYALSFTETDPGPDDPSTIADLLVWVRAADYDQDDETAAPSTWEDRSGNGNDLTKSGTITYRTAQTPAARAAFEFTTGARYDFPSGLFVGLTEATAFVLVKQGALSDNRGPWDLGGGDVSYYTYTDGHIYDGAFTGTRYTWTPSVDVTDYHIFSVTVSADGYQAHLDDDLQMDMSSGTFVAPTGVRSLGRDLSGFVGQIAECVIYARALSDVERAAVVEYLQS